MSINPRCNKCKKKLKSLGGILFGPPRKDSLVKKSHLCKTCYNKIVKYIKNE